MKTSELRGKDADALTKELQDLLKAQFSLRISDSMPRTSAPLRAAQSRTAVTASSESRAGCRTRPMACTQPAAAKPL